MPPSDEYSSIAVSFAVDLPANLRSRCFWLRFSTVFKLGEKMLRYCTAMNGFRRDAGLQVTPYSLAGIASASSTNRGFSLAAEQSTAERLSVDTRPNCDTLKFALFRSAGVRDRQR